MQDQRKRQKLAARRNRAQRVERAIQEMGGSYTFGGTQTVIQGNSIVSNGFRPIWGF